jgi:hypothetical protein
VNDEPFGTDRPAKPLPPTGIQPTKIWLAAVVPILAVGMLVIVIVINIATAEPPAASSKIPKLEKVSGLTTSSINPFVPLVAAGEPPTDVLNQIVLPEGASKSASPASPGSATSFDQTLAFTSPASEQAIYSFFDHEMTNRGWKVFSTGKPANAQGVEVLGQRAGSDGWYWVQGVVVSPTTFSKDGTQSTHFSVRLYQASDDA